MLRSLTSLIVGAAFFSTAVVATAEKAGGKVGKSLAGKLIKADGKSVKDYTIDASPEYYVVYHSASW